MCVYHYCITRQRTGYQVSARLIVSAILTHQAGVKCEVRVCEVVKCEV